MGFTINIVCLGDSCPDYNQIKPLQIIEGKELYCPICGEQLKVAIKIRTKKPIQKIKNEPLNEISNEDEIEF